MNKQQSPVAAIKQVLRSNKITFLCVVFTIAVFGSLIGLFENRFNPSALSFLGTDLYDLLGRDAMEVLDAVSGAIFAFSLIGLIPQILTAIAAWMLRTGANEGASEGTKKILVGLNLFKIHLLYKAIVQGLAVIGTVLIGLIVLFIALDGGAAFGGFLAVVIITAILAAVFYFIMKYYTNFLTMLVGISNTLRCGFNMIVSSRQVIVFNYIGAVFAFLGAIGNDFWTLLSGCATGLCLIFINLCFKDLEQLCGYTSQEDCKALAERIKADPSLAKESAALGLNTTEAGLKNLKTTLFGTDFVAEGSGSAAPAPAEEAPSHAEPNPYFRPEFQERPRNGYVPSEETRLLALFDRDMSLLDDRYTLLGKQTISKSVNCPVAPMQAEIVYDSVSEKKLLRLSIKNVSAAPIKAITLEITPKDNTSRPICVYRKVVIDPDAPIYADAIFAADYGILLPDDATNGTAKVTLVEFADGLYRDKESDEFFFSTDEKTEYDTELYLSVTTRIREKEL